MSIKTTIAGRPLEHRRLRFSFQINDFKDQTRKNQGHCFAPVSGGGGFLKKAVLGVNQAFQPFCNLLKPSFQSAKNRQMKRETCPLYRFRRFDWSAETMWNQPRKQGVSSPSFPLQDPGDLRPRGPGGRPVSERGGDIRTANFVRKRLFQGRTRFTQSPVR